MSNKAYYCRLKYDNGCKVSKKEILCTGKSLKDAMEMIRGRFIQCSEDSIEVEVICEARDGTIVAEDIH